jgi:hypothetical protein
VLVYYGSALTNWWFWALLPITMPLVYLLHRGLSGYSRRYWRDRGQPHPAHQTSYLDAPKLVICAALAGLFGAVELYAGHVLVAGLLAGAMVLFFWLALFWARQNII